MADILDVVIIGSGPGGYVAAIRAGQLGLKTAIVERDKRLGGTCLHRGCIPTKSLLWTAELFAHIQEAAEFGIDLKSPAINWAAAMKHKTKVVTEGANGIDYLMKKNKVQVLKGHGRIVGKGKVEVTLTEGGAKQTLETKNIVIATGSVPKSLPNVKVDHKLVYNSDSILEIAEIPKSIIVLGAGAVGCEFASIFNHVGSETTLVEFLPHLLAHRGRGREQGAREAVQAPEDRPRAVGPGGEGRAGRQGREGDHDHALRAEDHRGADPPLGGGPSPGDRGRRPGEDQHQAGEGLHPGGRLHADHRAERLRHRRRHPRPDAGARGLGRGHAGGGAHRRQGSAPHQLRPHPVRDLLLPRGGRRWA